MSAGKPIGLLGGAFDPVHRGHVEMALACLDALNLQEVKFIPANRPPHKPAPTAAARQRLAMLECAVRDHPQLTASAVELNRGGVSYTVDTLSELRAAWPRRSLCFIMGMDAFAALPTWRRWRELTDYVHLALVERNRPDAAPLDEDLQSWCAARACASPAALSAAPGGLIYKTDIAVPDVSSAQVRDLLRRNEDARALLPPAAHRYARTHRLYA